MRIPDSVVYRSNTASDKDIYEHLLRCSSLFVPSLDSYVDIKEYSMKIYHNAERLEAFHEGILVGLLAAYLNNTRDKEGFITNVSIERAYQGKAIASTLLQRFLELAKSKGFGAITLEVFMSNALAINLYNKYGFVRHKYIDNKIILKWTANANQA